MDAAPDSPGSEPPRREPPGSLRNAGAALVGLAGTRLELLGVELREEALHLQHLLVLGVVAAFFLGAALVLAGVWVAAVFWDTHRLLAIGAATLLYAIAGAGVLMRLRSSVYQRPPPFAATVRELEADLRALREASGEPKP